MFNVKGCSTPKWSCEDNKFTEPQRSHTVKELIYRYQKGLPLPRCGSMRYDNEDEMDDDDNMVDEQEPWIDITQVHEEQQRLASKVSARDRKKYEKNESKKDELTQKNSDESGKNVVVNQD